MGLRVGGVRPGGEEEGRGGREERGEEGGGDTPQEKKEYEENMEKIIPEGQFGPEHGLALQPRTLPGDLFNIFLGHSYFQDLFKIYLFLPHLMKRWLKSDWSGCLCTSKISLPRWRE